MLIRWHGHSCFEIGSDEEITVVTDPHDGKSIGIKQPHVSADIVLMSHDHFDHNCERIVQGLDKKVVTKPGSHTIKAIPILGVSAFHDEEEGKKRGQIVIFRFEIGGLKFCHLGDLGQMLDDAQAEKIGPVDILFIPVGGTFTLDAIKAWKVIKKLKPRVIVPMHFRVGGLSLSIAPVDEFLAKAKADQVVKVGNEIEMAKEDLPEEQEVWVFSL
ncbi:MAG: MBL fold metallo-hydrolase [Thermoplasmata archaeon]|nr:MBL fold metallo-hydrolase [Thermoplasmata archaeon]